MTTSTKHTFIALAVTALLGSCSRPVAYFQPSKAERFYTAQNTTKPAGIDSEVTVKMTDVAPVVAETATPTPVVTMAPATPATKADIENMLVKAEAVASTKGTASESRKLTNRISKIRQALAATPESNVNATASTKKAGLVQRLVTKSMDKKIQKKLAPENTKKAMATSTLTIGLVVGLIGLLLLLLGNGIGATIGLIALVVGIVLVILGLL